MSFAQGILEEVITDIMNLKKSEDGENSSVRNGKNVLQTSTFTEKSADASGSYNQMREKEKFTRETVKLALISSVKLSGENERGDAMRSYREYIEYYIKEELTHQAISRQIKTKEMLTESVKKSFESVCQK